MVKEFTENAALQNPFKQGKERYKSFRNAYQRRSNNIDWNHNTKLAINITNLTKNIHNYFYVIMRIEISMAMLSQPEIIDKINKSS